MSLIGVQSFMFRLKNDKGLQDRFRSGSKDAFEGFALTNDETRALASGDIEGLYSLGVHPLLLAPFSRYANIARPKYRERLAPLKGTRRFVS
jgi:hypothetical protein